MGMGCAWAVFIFLIFMALSPIIMLLDGKSTDGMGYYLVFSALAIWALYALFKNANKNNNSSSTNTTTTSSRTPRQYTPNNRTSSTGKLSNEDDEIVDMAIATGLAYHMLFKDSDSDTDQDNDIFSDKDEWDNDDDMYYMYGDDHDINDFDKDEWDDEW